MSSQNKDEQLYKKIIKIISSSTFRTPIKDFIDENCSIFTDIEENTFQQGGLYKEFCELIENLLQSVLKDNNITEEEFAAAAEKGLTIESDKKYFEQIIQFNDYNYFKKMMIHKNYQILRQVELAMQNKKYQSKRTSKKAGKFDENEIAEAIKLSLNEEEQRKKLRALEEEELKVYI